LPWRSFRLTSLAGAALEVGDERFDSHAMRQLYEADDYPLARPERVARVPRQCGRLREEADQRLGPRGPKKGVHASIVTSRWRLATAKR
jgi:hypothetical protein